MFFNSYSEKNKSPTDNMRSNQIFMSLIKKAEGLDFSSMNNGATSLNLIITP
jgi:hypothetical protein